MFMLSPPFYYYCEVQSDRRKALETVMGRKHVPMVEICEVQSDRRKALETYQLPDYIQLVRRQ